MIIIAEKITIHYCGKKNKLLSNEVFKNPKKVLIIYFDHLSKRVARRIILLFNPKLIVLLVLFFLIIL